MSDESDFEVPEFLKETYRQQGRAEMSDESDFEVPEFLKETYRQQGRAEVSDGDAFIEGMAAAHDVVWSTVDRLQQSLNDIMGVYVDMKSPIYDEQNQQARELEVAYRILSEFRERFVDNYDEVMRKHNTD